MYKGPFPFPLFNVSPVLRLFHKIQGDFTESFEDNIIAYKTFFPSDAMPSFHTLFLNFTRKHFHTGAHGGVETRGWKRITQHTILSGILQSEKYVLRSPIIIIKIASKCTNGGSISRNYSADQLLSSTNAQKPFASALFTPATDCLVSGLCDPVYL